MSTARASSGRVGCAPPSAVRGPVLRPPCIRQRAEPRTAGARHGWPPRVRAPAPQRGAREGSPQALPFRRLFLPFQKLTRSAPSAPLPAMETDAPSGCGEGVALMPRPRTMRSVSSVTGPRNQSYLQQKVSGFRRPFALYGCAEFRSQVASPFDGKLPCAGRWRQHDGIHQASVASARQSGS